jgi:cyanophycinase
MKYVVFLLLAAVTLNWEQSRAQPAQTTGPENGTLIIIGGGRVPDEIMNLFAEKAGGEEAKIVVIPTASVTGGTIDTTRWTEYFGRFGLNDVRIMHTSDPNTANQDDFISPLKDATGIYFLGGRQWRIADGFLNTKAHDEMFRLLDRGGVIAGSSAGATIQGSYLARGDTKNNQIMMGDHEEGLGFIQNIAIDQHHLARNRLFDMFDILENKPELLGVGIDEGTAMLVEGDVFEVIGNSYVAVYDGAFWSREGSDLKNLPEENPFYFLRAGDKYHMKNREVIDD